MTSADIQAQIDAVEAERAEALAPFNRRLTRLRSAFIEAQHDEWREEARVLPPEIAADLFFRETCPPHHVASHGELERRGLAYSVVRDCPVGGGYGELYVTEKGRVFRAAIRGTP